ncbi:MAG: response regulator receiver domain [Stagnimonas sp.]|nr:response regulator receiver domain [Stagnimonas sp.]
MKTDGIYAETVRSTFRKKALRTVFIIDDQFPSYEDLAGGEEQSAPFKEKARAQTLYRAFRQHQIPCDVENRIGKLDESIEYIRKSDLIVLDYNLAPNDTRQSIGLIKKLALTKHFNTIVLYTAEENLDEVWLNVAVNLRGDWKEPEEILGEERAKKWAELSDGGVLPATTHALIKESIVSQAPSWPLDDLKAVLDALKAGGFSIEKTDQDLWMHALVHRDVRERLRDDEEGKSAKRQVVRGDCKKNGARWIQCLNCFVAILGKPKIEKPDDTEQDREGSEAEATRIFECLDAAFLDWHPSLVQILISEIQNILELEAFANDEIRLRDPQVQHGLLYFLLSNLETGVTHSDTDRLMPPLQVILDKLLETIRHRITTDGELGSVAQQLFAEELKELQWPIASNNPAESFKKTFAAAKSMARITTKVNNNEVVFKLNSFLSTEPFRGGSVTTGTIFKAEQSDDFWICATPACDLVVRKPAAMQAWSHALDPMRPIVAVKMVADDWNKSLKDATQGKHIFLQTTAGPRGFIALDLDSGQPSYEFLFLHESAKTSAAPSGAEFPSFLASRLEIGSAVQNGVETRSLFERKFFVVGQLRPEYGNRLLQTTGQHLSRLGVDYMKRVPE